MPEIPVFHSMVWLLAATGGMLLAALVVAWWLQLRAARAARRRAAGRQLVECMKAYGAWMDCQRAEPFVDNEEDAQALPEPLQEAVALKDAHFPELTPVLLRLLRSHAAMTQMLWQHHILRITHVNPQTAVWRDPLYQSLRDQQDAAIDAVILECRHLVGEQPPQWSRTRSDFTFSSGLSIPSHPGGRP